MDELTFAERRDRVRQKVIDPLIAMGLRKPKSMTVEDHEAMLSRLCERLACMAPDWHAPLVEVIAASADPSSRKRDTGKPARDIWPSEIAILNWARAMQPIGGVSRFVATYMRSAAGRAAWDRSPFEASRLEQYLLKHHRPPVDDGAWRILAEEAESLSRRYHTALAAVRDGRATERDRRGVEAWKARAAYLSHLIKGDLDTDPGLAA